MMQNIKQPIVTKAESKVLIKNMIRISISSICYFRDLFPENCFKKKQYGSVQIHQLQGAKKENDGDISVYDRNAFLLTQWLEKGVFDALEKEFLKSMLFAIYFKHPITKEDILIESYEFRITYPSEVNGSEIKLNNIPLSKESVKNQAAKFIRSLTEFTSTLEELPKERWLTIQLKYTEDTPNNYEPEYFCSTEKTLLSETHNFPLVVNIGQIKTPDMDFKIKFTGLDSILFEEIPCLTKELDIQEGKKKSQDIEKEINFEKNSNFSNNNEFDCNIEDVEHYEQTSEKIIESGIKHLDMKESKVNLEIYNSVKEYILKTRCLIVSICSNELKIQQEDIREVMNQLVSENVLIRKGRKFAFSNNSKFNDNQFRIGINNFKTYHFSQTYSIDDEIEEIIEDQCKFQEEDIEETQLEPISMNIIKTIKRSKEFSGDEIIDDNDKENKAIPNAKNRAMIIAELNETNLISQYNESDSQKDSRMSIIKDPVVLEKIKRQRIY